MITSTLGEVKLTQPNYNLCKTLDCTKDELDTVVKATLVADLGAILKALEIKYGMADALEMWVKVADLVTELYKEEKEKQ